MRRRFGRFGSLNTKHIKVIITRGWSCGFTSTLWPLMSKNRAYQQPPEMSESVQAVHNFAPSRSSVLTAEDANPSTRDWLKHSALFLITFLTTTFAGIMIAAPEVEISEPSIPGVLGYLLYIPDYYRRVVSRNSFPRCLLIHGSDQIGHKLLHRVAHHSHGA